MPRSSGTCRLQTPISTRISPTPDYWLVFGFGSSGFEYFFKLYQKKSSHVTYDTATRDDF